jgi:hypothetical protein
MEPKDLLPILFERSNAAVTLWNIEIVVVLGLMAFLASAGKMIGHWSMKLALTVGFLVMAGNNVVALIEVMEQRQALVDFFRTLKSPVLALPDGGRSRHQSAFALRSRVVARSEVGRTRTER